MVFYYFVMMVLSVVTLMFFVSGFEGKTITCYFTLGAVLMALANLGYLWLALSSNLQEAILANQVCYLGGCFIPTVTLFSICAICNFRVNKWIRNLIYFYCIGVYALVLTIGKFPVYYSDVFLKEVGNATALGRVYAVGHIFFYFLLYGNMICSILLLLYTLRKKNAVSRKNVWRMLLLEMMNVVLFIGARKVNPDFEIMPFMYVVDGWILLLIHHRVVLYSVEDNILNFLGGQDSYAYIMFDNHMNYLGCNHVAEEVFPELSECKVDRPITGRPELDILKNWVISYAQGTPENPVYERTGRHYECHIERIMHGDKACGYIIEMQEDTDKWNYMNLMSPYNAKLETQVQEKTEHIRNIQAKVLLGMANMVENRDGNTGGHIRRTSDVIRILVDTIREKGILQMDDVFFQDIVRAAPMHDLGKIGIDDGILRKPGRLTQEEFAVMQTHAEKSAVLVESILKGVEEEHFVKVAVNIARYHHEKWNGAGYPEHLKGEEIPIEARIMAIADVYDALVSKRCYKEPMSFEEAFQVMEESMGSHFDSQLEPVFLSSRGKLEDYYRSA